MQKLTKDIADKDQRCSNIKQGFVMLNQMRNSMKDIMTTASMELKVCTRSSEYDCTRLLILLLEFSRVIAGLLSHSSFVFVIIAYFI